MRRLASAGVLAGTVCLCASSAGAIPLAYDLDPLTGESVFAPSESYRPQGGPTLPRQVVPYNGAYAPGTIVVSHSERRLYYVITKGVAIQYTIGVGRPGFAWSGTKRISRKREWPDWRPPAEMRQRRPDLPHHMSGGPENPLGARALYVAGSLYRIHGSNEPETVGQAVSSGCFRMTNDDVIDLYKRVRVGAKLVVLP
jgi:lipoprotein-anchoring transpeptidase ErfK/SrfK